MNDGWQKQVGLDNLDKVNISFITIIVYILPSLLLFVLPTRAQRWFVDTERVEAVYYFKYKK